MTTNMIRICGVSLAAAFCACDAATLEPLTDVDQPPGFAQSAAQTAPADNALTEARAQLGKRLFYDRRLSRDHTVSCASCHLQEHGFADPRPVSEGVQGRKGKRNAPHLANLAWVGTGLFWDGRAATLEDQALRPIADPLEMDLALDEAVHRLASDAALSEDFKRCYEGPPTAAALGKALSSFVRTLVSSHSRYDRFLQGDAGALTVDEERGRLLFFSAKTGCFHCHAEATLTNDGFFNNGSYVECGDVGRQHITGRSADLGAFRVPNLRNVEVTAPYMHDGSVPTLAAVVEQYSAGGRGHVSADPQIEPLNLSAQEKADLVAFLRTFTDHDFLRDPRLQP